MRERKVHLQALYTTWCGLTLFSRDLQIIPKIAKSFKDVTCKRCIKSPVYKSYLAGRFKEKP